MSPLRLLVATACVAALLSGCFGLPEGSAGTGDLVSIRYTAIDAATGTTLRANRTASFDVGSGASGLGLELERAVRGHLAGDAFTVHVADDPSLSFSATREVNRTLADIPVHQTAPLDDFVQFVGQPTVGLTFPAYGLPSKEAEEGVEVNGVRIPGLGSPNHADAMSVFKVNLDTGEVLAAKNPHGKFAPASTLKILTALTFIPRLDPDSKVLIPYAAGAVDGTTVGVVPGAPELRRVAAGDSDRARSRPAPILAGRHHHQLEGLAPARA